MSNTPLTIWCNRPFPEPALQLLREGTRDHRLVVSASAPDPSFDEADVAFGQPDPEQLLRSRRLGWAHLDTAGYTRYDRDDLRTALRARGTSLTNSSSVYDDPCAQHVLAMMLAFARQLPQSLLEQHTTRGWPITERRRRSHLLGEQTAVLLGFGSIARRLVELLAPFRMNVIATRRTPRGDEPVRVVPGDQTDAVLGDADHVINVLPDTPQTRGSFDAARFARMKATALFYNIGRGTTVDQDALIAALRGGRIAGAYLDVTDPEPLPPDHPLWRAPNCFITPHTGGGHRDEHERLAEHFLSNLRRFERDDALRDRVI
jgi:phosphoglycerate dehydrogenase-like enzyme